MRSIQSFVRFERENSVVPLNCCARVPVQMESLRQLVAKECLECVVYQIVSVDRHRSKFPAKEQFGIGGQIRNSKRVPSFVSRFCRSSARQLSQCFDALLFLFLRSDPLHFCRLFLANVELAKAQPSQTLLFIVAGRFHSVCIPTLDHDPSLFLKSFDLFRRDVLALKSDCVHTSTIPSANVFDNPLHFYQRMRIPLAPSL